MKTSEKHAEPCQSFRRRRQLLLLLLALVAVSRQAVKTLSNTFEQQLDGWKPAVYIVLL